MKINDLVLVVNLDHRLTYDNKLKSEVIGQIGRITHIGESHYLPISIKLKDYSLFVDPRNLQVVYESE